MDASEARARMDAADVSLAPHQVECVTWMAAREEGPDPLLPHVRGGILADRMGSGKTHMVAALMARRPVPTLVIATIGTLDHWFATLRQHGLRPCRVLSREHAGSLGRGSVAHSETVVTIASVFVGRPGREHPTAVAEMFARTWGRVVLDEAHVIRNPATQLHKALKRLDAVHRWAVTGTPVQNSERDLQALVAWVGATGLPTHVVVSHLLHGGAAWGAACPPDPLRGGAACPPDPLRPCGGPLRSKSVAGDEGEVYLPLPPFEEEEEEGRRGQAVPREVGECGEGAAVTASCPSVPRSGHKERAQWDEGGPLVRHLVVLDMSKEERAIYASLVAASAPRHDADVPTGDPAAYSAPPLPVALVDGAALGDASHVVLDGDEAPVPPVVVVVAPFAVRSPPWEAILRCRQAATHPRMLVDAADAARRRMRGGRGSDAAGVTSALARLGASGALEGARGDVSYGTKSRWLVGDLQRTDGTDRSIVFCDWIAQMEDLRDALLDARPDARVWTYHGGMGRDARQAAVREFSGAPTVRQATAATATTAATAATAATAPAPVVILIQVQCGAVGLNLQAANRVYLLAPQWNPTIEMQAIGRAHRMGQTRRVDAFHLVARGTVDELVIDVQGRKRRDIAAAFALPPPL